MPMQAKIKTERQKNEKRKTKNSQQPEPVKSKATYYCN
jgi:hypothetical protein